MKYLKILTAIVFISIFSVVSTFAIPTDTLRLTETQALQRFAEKNLSLLAERLNIDMAEAMIRQAKLWHNPTLEISEVNFWATEHQLSMGETLPPMFGNEAFRNRQVSAHIEQLFLIAGKRNKLIRTETINKQITAAYFDMLSLALRKELQNNISTLNYLEELKQMLETQKNGLEILVGAAKNHYENRDISRMEYFRLLSLLHQTDMELNSLNLEMLDLQSQLRVLLQVPYYTYLQISVDNDYVAAVEQILGSGFQVVLDKGIQKNPNLKAAGLHVAYHESVYRYEKAQAYPDIAWGMGYDRGGNFLLDFIGFGLSMDLPVFNRNQGNIRKAALEIQQHELLKKNTRSETENQIFNAWQQVLLNYQTHIKATPENLAEFDELMLKTNEYYADRTIGLLSYLDFFEAYREFKSKHFESANNLRQSYYKLMYMIGE